MSEQLNFNLGLDASNMLQQGKAAAQQLGKEFTTVGESIRKELSKPATMQLSLEFEGDPKKPYREAREAQRKVLKGQQEINQKRKLAKKLQDRVTKAVRGTAKEKRAALKLVERLMKSTGRTAAEMKKLAQYAKDLKASLPKDGDMPSGGKIRNMEGSLFRAGLAANLATKAIELLGRGIAATVQTGIKMQSLNLQMEAFAGGAKNARRAMARFQDIAAKTPLDVMQVAEAGKIMMAFGVETDLAVEATERLAITAAATGGDVNLLARNLGQVQAQGRAYTRDLTQFAIQGIPIWEELSKVTGRSVVELKKMASDGKVGMEAVMAALRNMTKEGSAFAMVAERMQETYAGKLAKLQSDFQTTAGQIVESINTIDNALGNVSGGVLDYISETMKAIQSVLEQTAALVEQQQFLKALEGPGFFEEMKQAEKDLARFIAKMRYGADELDRMFGGVEGLGDVISAQFIEAKDAADRAGVSMNQMSSKMLQLRQTDFGSRIVQQFGDLAREAGNYREELNANIQKLMDISGLDKARIKEEIATYEAKKTAAQDALAGIERQYQSLEDAAKRNYANIKASSESSIQSSKDIIAGLERQIQKTRELGPAGRALARLKREELEYTARTGKELKGHISSTEKRKLEARATLEQMEKQEQAAKLQQQIAVERNNIERQKAEMQAAELEMQQEMKEIDRARTEAIGKHKIAIQDLNTSIKSLTDVLGGNLAPNWEEIEGLINESARETGQVDSATKTLNSTISETIGEYNTILGQLEEMAIRIRNMPKVQTGAQGAFSGGPVSGGDVRTVNELGKEAFLSASGKLSMINAPAWGEWRAPSTGTIIPAHLTKQLDIPTGGININKTAGAGAGVGSAMRVIQAAGGDTFNQNVTVQADNPVQAANNIMVNMLRQRRMRRR